MARWRSEGACLRWNQAPTTRSCAHRRRCFWGVLAARARLFRHGHRAGWAPAPPAVAARRPEGGEGRAPLPAMLPIHSETGAFLMRLGDRADRGDRGARGRDDFYAPLVLPLPRPTTAEVTASEPDAAATVVDSAATENEEEYEGLNFIIGGARVASPPAAAASSAAAATAAAAAVSEPPPGTATLGSGGYGRPMRVGRRPRPLATARRGRRRARLWLVSSSPQYMRTKYTKSVRSSPATVKWFQSQRRRAARAARARAPGAQIQALHHQ